MCTHTALTELGPPDYKSSNIKSIATESSHYNNCLQIALALIEKWLDRTKERRCSVAIVIVQIQRRLTRNGNVAFRRASIPRLIIHCPTIPTCRPEYQHCRCTRLHDPNPSPYSKPAAPVTVSSIAVLRTPI